MLYTRFREVQGHAVTVLRQQMRNKLTDCQVECVHGSWRVYLALDFRMTGPFYHSKSDEFSLKANIAMTTYTLLSFCRITDMLLSTNSSKQNEFSSLVFSSLERGETRFFIPGVEYCFISAANVLQQRKYEDCFILKKEIVQFA